MKLVLGSLFVLALPFAVARADHPGHGPHHPPPQAAFDACAKARAGDPCSVTLHDHTMTGTCAPARDSRALVCRPDHPPGPPPEAIAACDGRAQGDACSMTHDGQAVAGTCTQHHGKGPLACRPSHAPPPP